LQSLIGNWLIQYVSTDLTASPISRARQPLLDAEIKIRAIPGTAGSYGCVMHLAPHHELDDMRVAIRLDTQLVKQNQTAN